MNRLERLTAVTNEFEREVSIEAIRLGNNTNHQNLRNQMIKEHGPEWVEQIEKEVIANAGY